MIACKRLRLEEIGSERSLKRIRSGVLASKSPDTVGLGRLESDW